MVRAELVEALRLDLVGPDNTHRFAKELLREPPSRWYLTGYLVPADAPAEQKVDLTSDDELDEGGDAEGSDDASPPDRAGARKSLLPSSLGLSVLVAGGMKELEAVVRWGDYVWEGGEQDEPKDEALAPVETAPDEPQPQGVAEPSPESKLPAAQPKGKRGYRRDPREERVTIKIPSADSPPVEWPLPNSGGLVVSATCRDVNEAGKAGRLPKGTRSVSVFLVNRRAVDIEHRSRSFVFQAELRLVSTQPFVARPDLRGGVPAAANEEWDELTADLQYRDVFEYAVGHGVSARATRDAAGVCREVCSCWIPSAEVERVAPSAIAGVELGMEALAQLTDGADAAAKLGALAQEYRNWISGQRGGLAALKLETRRLKTAQELLVLAEHAAKRIEAGIALLADAQVLEAFRIANRTMAQAARRREAIQRQMKPEAVDAPRWRPFQIAFILMTLKGIADPTHADRDYVDLLFFPTGGGKTEAYLGLAAFSMVLRRLRDPGIRSSGVSVLMRYTLRLLTLDQLSRASALVCALELEREKNAAKLGAWPFETGLWVGLAATPNRMGRRGDTGSGAEYTAYIKTQRFMRDSRGNPAPIPIENCPWCGTKFDRNSFRLVPTVDRPINLRVHCVNEKCDFSGDRPLPVLGVDEPIYRRLPAFLIATVDKFAALPWTGEAGTLLGHVDRYDDKGFYGPCSDAAGKPLGAPLPPPDLIIQDELHLISGPLGTVAGVYETAIDALASRQSGDKTLRPKVVASTATVRRADSQIRALFGRQNVTVFPPPGPDRHDSFFAHTERTEVTPARLYVGVAAPGRSLKVVLLRASLALLSAAQTAWLREGGKRNHANPADPYMTLLGYFNSLRELGGSRRIVEDEVRTRVAQYWRRKRVEPDDQLFSDRNISYDVLELTSREPTNKVAATKRRLALPFHEDERVDVALATNMISVGLDIIRLGLMVVLGQPKASAEYIQATSRVGRDPTKPGLVVTLLNVHKPRDRSHYERFETYHATFYRAVEATSVTPFSPRALDRALAAALVALVRQGRKEMTPALGAEQILTLRSQLDVFAERFAERARNHDRNLSAARAQALRDHVLARAKSLLDDWSNIAANFHATNTHLQYQQESGAAQRLLYEFLHPEVDTLPPIRRRFRANRSMRDVERSVEIAVKNLNDWGSP
ncbi:MAG: DISARM system helicase DrmA [Pseudomonadota bacterium]